MKTTEINQAWNGAEKCRRCSVRDLVLFSDLSEEDFCLLHLPIDSFDLKPNETLYDPTDKNNFVYTVRAGLIKLVYYLPNGNYRIIRLLRQGDLAGIEALNGSAYLHHAIAIQDSSVCRIPVNDIEQLNKNTSALYRQLTIRWQRIQRDADVWLTDLTMGNAKARMANLMIYLARDHESFLLPSREDLGAILAITTETASRIIAEFKRVGALVAKHHFVQIDRVKLNKFLQHEAE